MYSFQERVAEMAPLKSFLVAILFVCFAEICALHTNRDYIRDFRKRPPFCKTWCLVATRVGCCKQTNFVCCEYKEKPGICPISNSFCTRPHPYFATRLFQCKHDYSCPCGFKCCSDSCYKHKVCRPSWHKPTTTKKTTIDTTTIHYMEPSNEVDITTEASSTTKSSIGDNENTISAEDHTDKTRSTTFTIEVLEPHAE
ncbi:hypothetical protein FQA39_LY17147 [Lamprigera yunnana]|nr:hypothetical protein FQA39_LY17147 [Lamprigera yunnana]